jgi:hypothetical protein
MMMFFQAQRDEMKTIACGTWSLALLFWLCGSRDEAASPGSAVVFAPPGEQFSSHAPHLPFFQFVFTSPIIVSSKMIFEGIWL